MPVWKECKHCGFVHPVDLSCDAYKAFLGYFGSERRVKDYLHGQDVVRVGREKHNVITDVHHLIVRYKIVKWGKHVSKQTKKLIHLGFSEDYITSITGDKPYEIEVAPMNLLLNEGIAEVLDIIGGIGTTQLFNNANARVQTGTSTTAAAATDTGLLGTVVSKAMAGGFPSRAAQTISFKGADFASGDANQAWEEFSVDNGTGVEGLLNLNRKVQAKGTKVAGEIWTLQIDVTVS